ncbi:MAG: 2-dehydropantoate 2-reductase N-terminal domain-containing protein [Sphingomonas sp.]|uniref:ketopantoate reductase family protein n=1 Tax=Sphingomonas sp. TaxID=28214 RepID=UPI0035636E1C
MTDRILVWGAGAIGASIGMSLSSDGLDVTFVDSAADHVAAMRDPARGLRITGEDRMFGRAVSAWLPSELEGIWSCILLCVKAHHSAEACHALAPHLARDGYVVSLQNGLTEQTVAEIVGPERTIGAFVNFGADVIGPGRIAFGNRGAVALGELHGAITPRLEALTRTIQRFEPDAFSTDDIWSYLWGKLAYASMLFAQAAGTAGIVDCLERPELLPLWRALAGEVIAVAAAEGIAPRGFNGFDPAAFTAGASPSAAAASVSAIAAFNRPSAKTHSGVWRDLAVHRRATEVNAQFDPVIAAGARHGIACPSLRRLIAMIDDIETGRRPQRDDNLLALLETARA